MVLRAIRQYFFRQNLCNHIVFLLNKCQAYRCIVSMEFTTDSSTRTLEFRKEFRTPEVEEESKEAIGNPNSIIYAVAVRTDVEIIVCTLLRQILAACFLFLHWSGTIVCEVTGSRRASADLPNEKEA